jgi:predicted transcriptional regulator
METTISMKDTVLRAMQNLPEENTIDEAMERLLVLSKIEQGREDVRQGRTHTQEEVEEMSKKWLM